MSFVLQWNDLESLQISMTQALRKAACRTYALQALNWLLRSVVGCYILGFATGRDSTTFRDNGTEVSSLSRDKGTTGQAQNLATGRDGPGQPVKIRDGTRDGTITTFLSKSGTGHGTGQSLFFCQNPGRDRDGTIISFDVY